MGVSVRHSCGHAQVHDVLGHFAADLDQEAARLSRQRCAECEARERDDRLQAAVAELGDCQLPDLSGSFRQITWATTIRTKRLIELHKAGVDRVLLQHLTARTSAEWWIASRSLKRTAFVSYVQGLACGGEL